MKVMKSLFAIVSVIALLILLFVSVEGRGGESCQCFFAGECIFDDHGVGYKYYYCRGSCAPYSGWVPDYRCQESRTPLA